MITHMTNKVVPVRDQAAALAFYTDKLGFKVRLDAPFGEGARWIEVAPPGAQTAIVLERAGADEPRLGRFTGIIWSTADIHATYAELQGRGVQFTEVPTMQPWGMWQAQFDDQDGNGYVLIQAVQGDGAAAAAAAQTA